MIRSKCIAIALACTALVPASVAAQTVPKADAAQTAPSAEAFYRHALEQTRGHATPAFATYAAKVDGLDCNVEDARGGIACGIGLLGHSSTKEPLQVSYRASDDRLAVDQHGRSATVLDGPFLNATWRGVDDLIRWGFLGKPETKAQPTSVDPNSRLPVIAVVSSFSPEAYSFDDAGPSVCANGDPGHMVHLTALRDPYRYPLSAVVVNMRTGDLCMVRFGARIYAVAGLFGANGVAEVDIANENGYELVRSERIAINLRTAGVAIKHFDFGIAFSNYTFPTSISPVVFATPEPSPEPSPRTIVSP